MGHRYGCGPVDMNKYISDAFPLTLGARVLPGYSDTPKKCTQTGTWCGWYRVGELDLFEHAIIYRNALRMFMEKVNIMTLRIPLWPSSFCPRVALPRTPEYQIFARLVELLNTAYDTNIQRILTPSQSTSV